ncbi:dehydrogenase/reductase SDR family member 7B-like [Artemia franciscana]|uniref:dehydrogenase/reductase SDR family member 7B-like n=1 Tax=Artemia franciscana TaxID=6661 RepID=UPI0032DA47A8
MPSVGLEERSVTLMYLPQQSDNPQKPPSNPQKGLDPSPCRVITLKIHKLRFRTLGALYIFFLEGELDILVNNAGRSQRANWEKIELQVDRDLFEVNVFGLIGLTRTVLPHFLKKQSGHLVVTSSTAGKLGVPFSGSYTATKHALHVNFRNYKIKNTVCAKIKNCRKSFSDIEKAA